MVKLSQQIQSETTATRTERQQEKFFIRSQTGQEALPTGSLTKSNIQSRLAEEKAKEKQIEQDRQEEFNRLSSGGEFNRQSFNRKWDIKREQQRAKVNLLEDLNSKMTTRSYISKGSVEGYLSEAVEQANRDYERSERSDAVRVKAREIKETEKKETSIDAVKYLQGLEQVSTRKVKRFEGGTSEVVILEGGERKVQVVREPTGDVRITELKGKEKGAVLTGRTLSDAELENQALAGLQEEIKKGEEQKVDIEKVKVDISGLNAWQKTVYYLRNILPKVSGLNTNLLGIGGLGLGGEKAIRDTINLAKPKVVSTTKKIIASTMDLGIPVFTAGSGSTTIATVEEGKGTIKEDIGLIGKQEEVYQKDLEARGLTEKYKPKFEEEYKTEFLKKYGEKIITGEITQEKAETEFAKSDEAKEVSRRYQEVIDIERGKKITKGSLKLYGLGMAELGFKLIPETVGGLALETGAISSAVYLGGKIPTRVMNVAYGGGAVWGTATALDPTISPEKRIGGIFLAGTSLTMLGLSGVRYLRQPTIKQKIIKSPKISVKAESLVGKEKEIVRITSGGETKLVERVTFSTQKTKQIGIAGSRTVISTRWRDILRLDPIYKGVPTAQPVAYNKALNLLIKRSGYTPYQARNVLRYSAPRVIDVTLEKGVLNIAGNEARGRFVYRVDQPVINVDKYLGIKTRGATSFRNVYEFQRTLKGDLVLEKVREVSLKNAGVKYFEKVTASRVGDVSQGLNKISLNVGNKELIAYKEPYQFQRISGVSLQRQIYPPKRFLTVERGETTLIKRSQIDIDDINLDKIRGVTYRGENFVTPAKIIKTPFSKTFGVGDVEKVKEAISQKTLTKSVVEPSLKTGFAPTINVKTQIRTLTKLNQAELITQPSQVGLGVGTLTALNINQALKTDLKVKQSLKTNLKLDIKTDPRIKQIIKQAQATKTAQAGRVSPTTNLGFSPTPISIRTPTIPTFTTPNIPTTPFAFTFPLAKQKVKKKLKKKRSVQELALLPDFTARALGLEPKALTQQQALKELKQVKTGLEVRRSIKLLKGIPE
jgi:hypothetical protein